MEEGIGLALGCLAAGLGMACLPVSKGYEVHPDATEHEDRCLFAWWSSRLDMVLVLQVWAPGHPLAGMAIAGNARPEPHETIDEVKTVFGWARELADLEMESCQSDPDKIQRMYNISRMLVQAGLIWPGGPAWWREV